ncbi:uncharacterized protein DSM5745_11329 [Aspergillus mulundensis]|uniref:Uncharacterized protein n=1 Tax=Aspergillus mulundensis TaxID=1810919 RepID=A0A3D8Q815_9EURO|nr:Uncharacterized protein DSM5745_11329 [Aspergillus mulundensis]RDW57949.1 Uncharacterized protein DSM5745_11329 [Aspergillus mulundensis]
MGIVVSEDANRGRNEQQKINAIVAENDYGLVMVTLDQISVFLGSWWTTSLTGRIQTFKSYAHVPITEIINQERASLGALGFYFAGIPAWAMSTCLSICRHHPLERLISTIQNFFPNDDTGSKLVRASFTILHSAARGALLVLAMQTYMYSLLQSLHLIPPTSMPSIGHFMPFGEFTSMLLPSFPPDLSFNSLLAFVLNIMKTPSLFYIYVYLRPVIEVRLYRLIRRRLPKPTMTDDLSIKVALDNDLIDWMVPTLGRRAVEETQRSRLSLMEDLSYELDTLWQWLSSRFTFSSRRASLAQEAEHQDHPEPPQPQGHSSYRALDPEEQHRRLRSAQWHPADQSMSTNGFDAHSNGGRSEISNEENQTPDADNMDLLRRARNLTLSTRTSSPGPDAHQHEAATLNRSRRQSRSETLLSRTPSPTSSQSSPRVRAQLIQDSDVIAMQLELESRRSHQWNDTTGNQADLQNVAAGPAGRPPISDLLDTIVSQQDGHVTTILNSQAPNNDGLQGVITAVTSSNLGEPMTALTPGHQPNGIPTDRNATDSSIEPTTSDPMNILPDVVEEPPLDDASNHLPNQIDEGADSEIIPHMADPSVHQNSTTGTVTTTTSSPSHRVTILSSFPVDSLASHLAAMITTALFAPLESFYLRSLAKSYFASKGAPAILRSDVYPLGVWGGGRSSSNTLAYMSKLALMMGLQAAVNASVWGIISGAAIRIGRKWCGWGTL